MSSENQTSWGVFSRAGRRTHFRICVATREEAQVELERIRAEEGSNQDEYWTAELDDSAEAWARSMNIYKAREHAR